MKKLKKIKFKNNLENKKKIKSKLKKDNLEFNKNDYYQPKLCGESKTVAYQIDGLVKSYCDVSEWPSGEGFTISFETENKEKYISLHHDELDALLACLDHLGYFNE